MTTTMDTPTADAQTAPSGAKRQSYKTLVHAAKKLAKLLGDEGGGGGWISTFTGQTICQGWASYATLRRSDGLIEQIEGGRAVITERGYERAAGTEARREKHRVTQLRRSLKEIAQDAQGALEALESRGLCGRSMDAVMRVESKGKEITEVADQLDWRC